MVAVVAILDFETIIAITIHHNTLFQLSSQLDFRFRSSKQIFKMAAVTVIQEM